MEPSTGESINMSITDLIGPHLPYLRRFARALCGAQDSGDAYVVATLETLVADRTALRTDIDPKLALYQLFLSIWNGTPINARRRSGWSRMPGSSI